MIMKMERCFLLLKDDVRKQKLVWAKSLFYNDQDLVADKPNLTGQVESVTKILSTSSSQGIVWYPQEFR